MSSRLQPSLRLHLIKLRGKKERKKKTICSSSGQLQLLEAPSGQQIMTKLPQRLCNTLGREWGRGKKHVEPSRRRLLSALDLIRGRGDALAPHQFQNQHQFPHKNKKKMNCRKAKNKEKKLKTKTEIINKIRKQKKKSKNQN